LFPSNLWISLTNSGGANYADNALNGIMADASNNIYIVPNRPTAPNGKSNEPRSAYASVTSNGSARYTRAINFAPSGLTICSAALRTDDILVIVGFGNDANLDLYAVNASTGAIVTTPLKYVIATAQSGNAGQVLIDSSNNIYILRNYASGLPRIYKLNSSYGVVAAKSYTSPSGQGQSSFNPGAVLYNNTMYIITSTGSQNALTILAVNPSTLAPIWSLNAAFTGITTLSAAFQESGQVGIRVTSVGIYIATLIIKGVFNNTCIIKLPLDGNISGDKTISLASGGSTCTVSFTYSTSVWTASDTNFSTDPGFSVTINNYVFASGSGSTPTTGNTPTRALSTF
jgi:hypothetical protein